MSKSRRQFLTHSSAGLLGLAVAGQSNGQQPSLPPGAPPAFGTAAAVGPDVSTVTFAEAEKLVQMQLTVRERSVAADSWRKTMAPLYERRTGPRKVALDTAMNSSARPRSRYPTERLRARMRGTVNDASAPVATCCDTMFCIPDPVLMAPPSQAD